MIGETWASMKTQYASRTLPETRGERVGLSDIALLELFVEKGVWGKAKAGVFGICGSINPLTSLSRL